MDHQRLITSRQDKTQQLVALLSDYLERYSKDAQAEQLGLTQLAHLVKQHCDRLVALTEHLSRQEEAFDQEQSDDIELRGQIAEVALTLHQTLCTTRERLIEVDRQDTLQIYGLQERPPRARAALVHYSKDVINLMRAHPYTFRDDFGEPIDTRRVAARLQELLDPLEVLVSQMNHELDDLQEVLKQRNEALERWSDVFNGLCKLTTGFMLLTNTHDVAEKIHRIQRQ